MVNGSGNWRNCTNNDVSNWIETVLKEKFEDDHERANGDIVVFMQMFDSSVITTDTIRKLSRNDRFLSKFKWPTFEYGLKILTKQNIKDKTKKKHSKKKIPNLKMKNNFVQQEKYDPHASDSSYAGGVEIYYHKTHMNADHSSL